MADEQNPQVGNTTAQAATQGSGAGAASTSTGQAPEGDLSPEELRAQLKEARREAAKHRTEKNEVEKKLKVFEDAQLTESDRIKKEAEEAKAALAQAKAEARNAKIEAAATKLGFHDPADALVIGDAEDIETALQELAKKKPYLVKSSETITTTSPSNVTRSAAKPAPAFDPESLRNEPWPWKK